MRFHALVLTGLLTLSIAAIASKEPRNDLKEQSDLKLTANSGRIIVKYRESVSSCVHCKIARRSKMDVPSLDELHEKLQVKSARPVFRTEAEEEQFFGDSIVSAKALKNYHAAKLNFARERFSSRQKRKPGKSTMPDLHHIYIVEIPEESDVVAAASAMKRNPHVEYAHPDYVMKVDYDPRDPFYHSAGSWRQTYDDLWALKADKLDLEPAWEKTRGKGIIVGVVDSGLDYNHEDIASNVWKNKGEIAGNKRDDDGNGLIDDVRGYDFTTCSIFNQNGCNPKNPDDDPVDENSHGTHVAGTIAAIGNQVGIIGVAPEATIMPVRSFNSQGLGLTSDTATAVVYAATNGADVINNSWGCSFCPSVEVHEDALRTAYELGVVLVYAAGNSSTNVRLRSPHNSHDPKPVVVAATNQLDAPTFFTSFGVNVDVSAPGGGLASEENVRFAFRNILSLRAKCCSGSNVGTKYLRQAGTSMSAPHVSGLAALIIAHRPDLTNDEVRQVLRVSSDDIHDSGFDELTGAGRLNASRALQIDSVLKTNIERPAHMSITEQRSISIQGTAAGPKFEEYQLFYKSEYEDGWRPIGQPRNSAVQKGKLAGINLSKLPLGWKVIRLSARDLNDRTFEDLINVGTQLKATRLQQPVQGRASRPDISNELIVWDQHFQKKQSHVYLADLKSNRVLQISTVPVRFPEPRISENLVVWRNDPAGTTPGTIYACSYDAAAGTCPVFEVDHADISSHDVNQGRIIWSRYTPRGTVLMMYDVQTRERKKIDVTTFSIQEPHIDGKNIVFSGRQTQLGGEQDIFLFDLEKNSLRKLSDTSDSFETTARISGRWVIFDRGYDRGFGAHEIIAYDLDTGTERKLTDDFNRHYLNISGNLAVWSYRQSEIHLYDLSTNQLHGIVIHPLWFRIEPAIDGRRVVWNHLTHFGRLTGEIYYSRF